MYTYRNTKTGIEFTSVTECKGENLEQVGAEPKQEEEKKPVRGKKK